MLIEKIELGEDERVLAHIRRHWFVLTLQLATPVLLAILPPLLLWFVAASEQLLIAGVNISAYSAEMSFLYAAWLLLLWMFAFTIWTHHYLDILILTNERVVLIDQRGLFHRTVASFHLERLQDIHTEIDGIIPTFLDYGTIHAETAGHSEREFLAVGLPHPRELKAQIIRAADAVHQQVTP